MGRFVKHLLTAEFALAGSLAAVVLFAIAGTALLPRALEAGWLLAVQDDPALIADHLLKTSFTSAVAEREIETALQSEDADLAASFVDLARDRGIAVDPAIAEKVADANSTATSAVRHARNFTRGLVSGEHDDAASLVGTVFGDLFVLGDLRDAVREGARLAAGEVADNLVLGLAGVGLAVTAGTYATLGTGAPARVGLSLVKAVRKSEYIGAPLAGWVGRSLREVVDTGSLRRALTMASLSEPAVAVRTARNAIKLEKAEGLIRVAGDLRRVQSRAGTRAALDGLKHAQGPRDVARLAKLAEREGGKTRAILKLVGRAAIAFTFAAFDLASWLFAALLAMVGFCSSVKSATERLTIKIIRYRKRQRYRREASALAMAPVPV